MFYKRFLSIIKHGPFPKDVENSQLSHLKTRGQHWRISQAYPRRIKDSPTARLNKTPPTTCLNKARIKEGSEEVRKEEVGKEAQGRQGRGKEREEVREERAISVRPQISRSKVLRPSRHPCR